MPSAPTNSHQNLALNKTQGPPVSRASTSSSSTYDSLSRASTLAVTAPPYTSTMYRQDSDLTTSSSGTGPQSPVPSMTPTEQGFFSALTTKIRGRSRSRSRSRNHITRNRSQSPALTPPETLTAAPTSTPAQQTTQTSSSSSSSSSRPQNATRHFSQTSRLSTSSSTFSSPQQQAQQDRQSKRQSADSMWYGRHSNQWLFNDFSVTDTAKKLLRRDS